jgi:hypothetical protein
MKLYANERRKTKRDKKAKRLYKMYKKGGFHRTSNIKLTNEKPNGS